MFANGGSLRSQILQILTTNDLTMMEHCVKFLPACVCLMADLFLMSRELQCNLHKILNKTVIFWKLKVVMCLAVAYLGHQILFIVIKYSFIILQHV